MDRIIPKTLLKSESLMMRAVLPEDTPFLTNYLSDGDIARQSSRIPSPYTPTDAAAFVQHARQAWQNGSEYCFIARYGAQIQAMASLAKQGDDWFLGFNVNRAARGKSIGTQAARLLCDFGFSWLRASTICAHVFHDNAPSQRLLSKIGFEKVDTALFLPSKARRQDVPGMLLQLSEEKYTAQRQRRFQRRSPIERS